MHASELQRALKVLGFDPGLLDNDEGPKTRAAIKMFQRSAGIEETGEADVTTLRALKAAWRAAHFEAATPQTDA
jgi:peptidoglycan hydrolase-like protein with peptidoglycan-binding domain